MNNIDLLTKMFIAIGIMATVTSCITQAIKDTKLLKTKNTNTVVLLISIILSELVTIAMIQIYKINTEWYYFVSGFCVGFVVYLVSVGGWERVHSIYDRTKYKRNNS